jgi:hypothetical protein
MYGFEVGLPWTSWTKLDTSSNHKHSNTDDLAVMTSAMAGRNEFVEDLSHETAELVS